MTILIFYFVALLAALANYRRFFDTPLGFFPLLIAYTFFNELLGFIILHFEEFTFFEDLKNHWKNTLIYNIYHLFFYAYLYWVYYKMLTSKNQKKIVLSFAATSLIGYLVSLFFQNPLQESLYFGSSLNCILILILVYLHFNKLKKLNATQPSRFNLMVWFNFGIGIFCLYYPFYIINGYHNVDFYLNFKLSSILYGIVAIMYSLFSLGFTISKRRFFA